MNSKNGVIKNDFVELLFKHNNKTIQLANWCDFFIELGGLTSRFVTNDSKFITALAVPTRSFSSTLISFGYIIKRIKAHQDDDFYAYAEYLKTLPLGTPVLVRSAVGKKFKGLLHEHVTYNDKLQFGIKVERSSIRYIKAEESKRIEIIDSDVDLPKTQKGRAIIPETDFCAAILGKECASSLISKTNLEIVIIGPKKLVRNEVIDQEFLTRQGQAGVLQEILRVKEFQSHTKSYRTRIISDRNKAKKVHSSISDPSLVIFDGAQGFLKWRGYWKKSNWIVILDRTEYQFDPGLEQINKEYILNRKNDYIPELVNFEIPSGIEMMVFEVRA